MKKSLFSFLIVFGFGSRAICQINDLASIKTDANNSQACTEYGSYAIKTLPDLYRQHKMDSILILLRNWEKSGDKCEPFISCFIINQIIIDSFYDKRQPERPKNEDAKNQQYLINYFKIHAVSYLRKYMDGYYIRGNPGKYFSGDTSKSIINLYADYYDFLRSWAASVADTLNRTETEKLLIRFYANPDTTLFGELKSGIHRGHIYKKAKQGKGDDGNEISGIGLTLSSGAWVPMGNLSAFRSQPFFEYAMGRRTKKIMYHLNIGCSFGQSVPSLMVKHNDSLFYGTSLFGSYIGLDMGYELLRKNSKSLNLIGSIDLAGFSGRVDNSSIGYGTLDYGIGLSYGLLWHSVRTSFERHKFAEIRIKYHFLNYQNPGGTDISGNSVTIGLSYGFYNINEHFWKGRR
jgi:hypothetical protein